VGMNASLRLAKFPLATESGSVLLGGIAVDVTERKRVEEALRESEAPISTGGGILAVAHGYHQRCRDDRVFESTVHRDLWLHLDDVPQLADCNRLAYPTRPIGECVEKWHRALETTAIGNRPVKAIEVEVT